MSSPSVAPAQFAAETNRRFRDRLRGLTSGGDGLESAGGGAADLSNGAIKERVESSTAELHRVVKSYLGDGADKHALVDRLAASGGEALRRLRDDDPELALDPDLLTTLEAIVKTDGSRPSFLIKNDEVDRASSPLGNWKATLDASVDGIRAAVACVGRIDSPQAPQKFEGTGFLVADDVIVTNRHVLQAVADPTPTGGWRFRKGVRIDFGYEFGGRASVGARALRKVLYAGPQTIEGHDIDHNKLDLAVIQLGPLPRGQQTPHPLAFDVAPDWATPQQVLFTAGYPGVPPFGVYTPTLLEKLFETTFGFKRLAPGLVAADGALPATTLAHDATTLGGNSGSVILVVGREGNAAGLHYGGRTGEPRENWAHVLGQTLATFDPRSGKTLRQCLEAHGVKLVDRIGRRGGH